MGTDASRHVIVVGGGPAGLMAAEAARAAGCAVDLYERMGSVGRKFLIAGKGGLNLTHADPFERFVSRYGARAAEVGEWLRAFDADALRAWARGLGVETFVGTSGRVFPSDLKAAPLLRRWVQRLRHSGVRFHVHARWLGFDADGAARFETPAGETRVEARAFVLALGGASWPILGSDGAWVPALEATGADVAPLAPANCGFDVGWSAHFAERFAGVPLKPVALGYGGASFQGELMVTATGLEGGLIYAHAAPLRDAIARDGATPISLDLVPGRSIERLAADLAKPRKGRSLSEHLRRQAGIAGVKAGLLYETVGRELPPEPSVLAAAIKAVPVVLRAPRPIDEAISTAGGVRLESLTSDLMLRARPGVFVAGEMLDWEAPTGGYLLTACFASGKIAGEAAAGYVGRTAAEGGCPPL